jgi:Putative ER transporter, 6TM, N-terminal
MRTTALFYEAASQWLREQGKVIWDNVVKKGLWKRMLKITIATSAANAIMLIPQVEPVIGKAAYLAGITTGFGHPGRRFGQMAEALILTVSGTLLGLSWALLGLYLGSLLIETNPPAAYTVRAIFLAIAFLLHGFYRSHTPRLFLGTVLWIIINVVTLVSPAKVVTVTSATQILYPILTAVGILFLVNICIFPEFSSGFLGETALETMDELFKASNKAIDYFLGDVPGEVITEDTLTIEEVTASKAKVRAKLANFKAIQSECNFELAFSVIEPQQLKPITDALNKFTMNIIAMSSACESKFALIGEKSGVDTGSYDVGEKQETASSEDSSVVEHRPEPQANRLSLLAEENDLELVKPRREIEFGDPKLLLDLAGRIAVPCQQLRDVLGQSLKSITGNIAFAYVCVLST